MSVDPPARDGNNWFVVETVAIGFALGRPTGLYGPGTYPDCVDKLLKIGGQSHGIIFQAMPFRINRPRKVKSKAKV